MSAPAGIWPNFVLFGRTEIFLSGAPLKLEILAIKQVKMLLLKIQLKH